MIHDPHWKIRKWMLPYLKLLSVQNPKEVRATMTTNVVTYMGEKLKVEFALLARLREAGELKRGGLECSGATAKKKSKR